MKINKIILKNGFTYQELLRLKNLYRDKKSEIYGKKTKVTEDESLRNYILLIADLCGGSLIIISSVFLIMALGANYYSNDPQQAIFYMIFFVLFISFSIWNNSRCMKLNTMLTVKLIQLRLLMFLYKTPPPKIK